MAYSVIVLLLPFIFAISGGCSAVPLSAAAPVFSVATPEPYIRGVGPAPMTVPATPTPVPTPIPENGLVLSEICYCSGGDIDWVELYNRTDAPVSSAGYCLSDRRPFLMKSPLPEVVIQSGQRVVFYGAEAGFAFKGGETVYLTNAVTGMTESLVLPERTGYTCGPGETGPVLFRYATPGAENAPSFAPEEAVPAYETDGLYINEVAATGEMEWIELRNGGSTPIDLDGWYVLINKDPARKVSLSGTAAPGAYTVAETDLPATGALLQLHDPHGFLRDSYETGLLRPGYTSGRDENGVRVFYAAATQGAQNSTKSYSGYAPSVIPSETGLYHNKPFRLTLSAASGAEIRYTLNGSEPNAKSTLYKEPINISSSCVVRAYALEKGKLPGEFLTLHFLFTDAHTVPVVCLSMPEAKWSFLAASKYRQAPIKTECVWYEKDGSLGVSFPADIVLRGEASRYFDQKSYSLHLRKRYGVGSVQYPFWQEEGVTSLSFSSFALRSSSQDLGVARLRDSFASRAVRGMNMETAMTRPVVLYVNGAYRGIYDFKERLSHDYVETHYGCDGDTVNIIFRENTVKHGFGDDFFALCTFARNTFTEDDYKKLFTWIDVDYFTDYLIAQTFFGNYDTPNQRFWATSDLSIRWRPVFNDIDRCLCTGHTNEELFSSYFNPAGITLGIHKAHANTDVFCALRWNSAWCDAFVERYAELLSTVFSVENLQNLLDEMAAELEPEMSRHIALWGKPYSVNKWKKNVLAMRKEIPLRHAAIQEQIKCEFSVPDELWCALMEKYGGSASDSAVG